MAQIVSVVASTHNPRIFWNRDQADPKDMEMLYATFAEVRQMLAATKPELIVGVANDHLDNFFFDNLPTFAVGTGPIAEGPFWYETDVMNLPR
jgi:protocatechuate 4,5-dioxygenase, beta chain